MMMILKHLFSNSDRLPSWRFASVSMSAFARHDLDRSDVAACSLNAYDPGEGADTNQRR